MSGYPDLALWVELRNAAAPDDPETVEMMALVRARELQRMDLLAFLDGEPAGAAFLAGDPASVASTHPYVDIRVQEPLRGRGVGTALVRELAEGARRQGKVGFECSVLSTDAHSLGYVERRGYRPIRSVDQWTLDLTDELPEDRPLYIVCASGGRSLRAATALQNQAGIEAISIAGGTKAWVASGRDYVTGDSPT